MYKRIALVVGFSILTVLTFSQNRRYSFEHPQMGTLFRIVLYAPDSALASSAAAKAFACIDHLNQVFSDYHPESELNKVSALSGRDTCIAISGELADILRLSQQMNTYTLEAFDISIGPLVQLWRRAKRKGELPPKEEIEEARKAVGNSFIVWDSTSNCIRLTRAHMRLDLGGIAKGYAADKALEILNQQGIFQALIDAGGDLVLGDSPPNKPGWEVGMEYADPRGLSRDTVLILANRAIASSGDTYRHIEIEGKRYSHIMDPTSGFGLTVQRKVTVIAPSGAQADAWASALSIMGPLKGLHRLKAFPEIKGMILDSKDQKFEIALTPNFFNSLTTP